ncbi:hypothetical protein, partial [Neisseria sp. P0022.S010]
ENGLQPILKKYTEFPFDLVLCFRCLEKDSGWKSKSRYSKEDNYNALGFDIVVSEEDFIPIKKDIDAQRKILGKEFYRYFFETMKKKERQFPILKKINPNFLYDVKKWLLENKWIDAISES